MNPYFPLSTCKPVTRKDENHAISNHSKRYYKNESRRHRECRLPDTFGRGRGRWRDPSGGGAGAPRGVPDAPWLPDGRCEDHEGLSVALQMGDSYRRACLAWRQPWGTGASSLLLQKIFGTGGGVSFRVHRLSADFIRGLRISERGSA